MLVITERSTKSGDRRHFVLLNPHDQTRSLDYNELKHQKTRNIRHIVDEGYWLSVPTLRAAKDKPRFSTNDTEKETLLWLPLRYRGRRVEKRYNDLHWLPSDKSCMTEQFKLITSHQAWDLAFEAREMVYNSNVDLFLIAREVFCSLCRPLGWKSHEVRNLFSHICFSMKPQLNVHENLTTVPLCQRNTGNSWFIGIIR